MSIYCAKCDTANRDGSIFCNNCGQRLDDDTSGRRCPLCSAVNLPAAQYCHRCGARLPEITPPAAEATWLPEEEEPLEAETVSLDQVVARSGAEIGAQAAGSPVDASARRPVWGEPLTSPSSDDLVGRLVAGLGPWEQGSAGAEERGSGGARERGSEGAGEQGELPGPLPMGPGPTLAETFAAVAAARPSGQTSPEVTGSLLERLGRWVIRLLYLALLVAVVLPFLVAGEWSGSTIPLSLSTANFFETVSALRPGSPVLVAFDYDPGTQAELDPQARVVLAHLMQRGARIVAVSLFPQGPAIAQAALRATAPGQEYRYGEDYLNLGYLAGEEAALATLGQSLVTALPIDYVERKPTSERSLLQEVKGVSGFALVIVFAQDDNAARRWLQQVQGRYQVKMVAGVSAVAATQMEPYLQSKQLAGFLSGLPGAAEYELLLNQPGKAVQMLDAQSLAHGVIVAFVILGNVGYVVWRIRQRMGNE